MKSYLNITFIICIILPAQNFAQTNVLYDQNKAYSVEELHFDLAVLRNVLTKAHPGLYWYQPEKDFEDNYIRIKNSINRPMTELEFYSFITPLISSIKCQHTDLEMSEAFYEHCRSSVSVFPFGLKIMQPKIFLVGNYTSDTTIAVGSEILSINGIKADSICRFLKPQVWTDGFVECYTRAEMEHFLSPLFLKFFNYPDKYVVNTIDPAGNAKTIEAKALNCKTVEQAANVGSNDDTGNFKFRIIDSLNTALIRISSFMGSGYYKFIESSFKEIRDKKIGNLIIDLRGNFGGDGYYGRPLYDHIALKEYSYYDHLEMVIDNFDDSTFKYGEMPYGKMHMKYFHAFKLRKTGNSRYDVKNSVNKDLSNRPYKPHKDNFTENVYVLIDERSSSTTTEFCAITHYHKRAKFIGRETGGTYNGNTSGWEFLLTLPKTKLVVHVPLIKYYLAVKGPHGRGIEPDYPLEFNMRDLNTGRDSDFLFTLDLIKRTK